MYRDFRELLARRDIDAVLITTGDRWHALGSVLAAKAGKDVYVEKPCSMTIGESQILADTMRRYGRVFQVGTQRRNIGNFKFAVGLARSWKLGKLQTLHASIAYYKPQIVHEWLPAEPEPPKETEDWDLWLEPAPWRPYNHAYVARSSHVAGHAAAIAWMLDRKVAFDPVKEAFIGDDEANRMRTRAMREPWRM